MLAEVAAARPVATYKWWVVAMLWLVCFFNYADRQAMYAVFPVLKEEFGFGNVELGLIGSAFMWVYAGGAPLAGWLCDRVPRTRVILGGCVCWSVVTVMTGWCGKLWHFVTVRALEGLGETFYFPASMSLLSDYHGRNTRSRAMAFHQSSVYIGTIAGSWLGAWFAESCGWRIGFYLFGGLGLVLALILLGCLREPRRGMAEEVTADAEAHAGVAPPSDVPLTLAATLRSLVRSPVVPLLMLAFMCANFVATIFLTWTPTFLVEKFHFRLTSAGLSGAVFIHLASAASVPLAGWIADRLVRRFPGARMALQAAGLIVGALFVVLVGIARDTTTLLVSMGVFGLCKGFYDAGIFASLYDHIEPRARGSAAGLMNTVGWGGGALGPLVVGLVSRYGSGSTQVENMSGAIAWCGGIYVVAALLMLAAMWKSRRRAPTLRDGQ